LACQDDCLAGAQHDTGGVGIRKKAQLLGDHIAGLEVGHQQNVGITGDG